MISFRETRYGIAGQILRHVLFHFYASLYCKLSSQTWACWWEAGGHVQYRWLFVYIINTGAVIEANVLSATSVWTAQYRHPIRVCTISVSYTHVVLCFLPSPHVRPASMLLWRRNILNGFIYSSSHSHSGKFPLFYSHFPLPPMTLFRRTFSKCSTLSYPFIFAYNTLNNPPTTHIITPLTTNNPIRWFVVSIAKMG